MLKTRKTTGTVIFKFNDLTLVPKKLSRFMVVKAFNHEHTCVPVLKALIVARKEKETVKNRVKGSEKRKKRKKEVHGKTAEERIRKMKENELESEQASLRCVHKMFVSIHITHMHSL